MTQVNTNYSSDGYSVTGGTTTTNTFHLKGGRYGVLVGGTITSVTLQMQGPDASTFITLGTSTSFTAAGYVTIDLMPGIYQLAIVATSALVSLGLIRGPTST